MRLWNDDNTALLKAFWAEGYTAAEIAGMLGGISPNAVGGKIYRLGLPKRREVRRVRVRIAQSLPLPESLRVSMLDLEPSMCRWPEDRAEGESDGRNGGYFFCGHARAAGYSYCPAHAQIAYRAEPGGIVVRKIDLQLAEAA